MRRHRVPTVARRSRRSNRGMTVVEVLIAFAVVAMVALASASFFNQQRNLLTNFSPYGECKAVLEGQMNYIRQQGMAPIGLPWQDPPTATSTSNPVIDYGNYTDPWLPLSSRFSPIAGVRLLEGTSPPNKVELKNYPLQRGSMGLLNSLYNQYPTLRAPSELNVALIAPPPSAAPDHFTPKYDDKIMKDFQSTMSIQPYNLVTRSSVTVAGPLWIRPRGLSDFVPNPPYQLPASVRADLGYRVTLKATYKDNTFERAGVQIGELKNCSLAEDFSYPIDAGTQSISVIWNTTYDATERASSISPAVADGASGVGRPLCSHVPGMQAGLTLTIGFKTPTGQPIETGTTFMCRDISQQMNANYCEDDPSGRGAASGAVMKGENYNIGGTANPPWVPCSKVTACGIKPDSSTSTLDPSVPGSVRYQLHYKSSDGSQPDGLWGCDINIDVATIDLAGNIRQLSKEPPIEIAPGIKVAPSSAKTYFQPVACYKCYKKKKRNWGSFAVSAIVFGPLASCLAGVGGVCRPKGVRYVTDSCTNGASGSDFCQLLPMKTPPWMPKPPVPQCPAKDLSFPSAYTGGRYTLLQSPAGTLWSEVVNFSQLNGYCEVNAYCNNGRWEQIPDELGGKAPYIECGKIWTQYKINIAGVPVNSVPPQGVPSCTIPVPDAANFVMNDYNTVYGGMKICAPAITGATQNLICAQTFDPSTGFPVINYPMNAQTGDPDNMDPDKYFYYKSGTPPPGLPQCSP